LSGLFDILPVTHHLLAFLALVSIIFGNLCALVQKDLRRLLAYSTISHMGYAILGFVAGGQDGETASLFYILVYALMTVAGFSAILIAKEDKPYLLKISDLQGLSKTTPWLAAMLMIVFFSMAGIPPAIGFFAKFFVIRALVDSSMYLYAIFALIFAVVGTFYYLKLIKTMYFDAPELNEAPVEVSIASKALYAIQALTLLVLGLMPNLLISACFEAF
jgi:NADH-quinone oxidoreductase subunit N